MKSISFFTEALSVVPFEDDDVNPGMLGRGIANWVEKELSNTPFPISEVIAEDWGYCAIVRRQLYMLWVGCAGQTDVHHLERGLSPEVVASIPALSIEWTICVTTEGGVLNRLFERNDRNAEASKLDACLTPA
ncbi:MAG: hypothetical protein HC794_09790 [Nitrospiraceae bacterium]|nr:hypothetical protein [Nitrospiraceae bacterium]